MENILLIRLKSIGDVAFTQPAVNAIRNNFPSAKITFLTSKENAVLLRGFREVNEVIPLDRTLWRTGNPIRILPEFFHLLRRLRAARFSLAIDFQGYGETAWLTRLSGAPRRWGSVYGSGRKWAYTRALKREEKIHPADWNLLLLQQCGLKTVGNKYEFVLPDDALATAHKFFLKQKLEISKPTLFLHPFTSSPQKNWPLKNYLALAEYWRSHGRQIIFGGGPADCAALEAARLQGFCISAGLPLLGSVGLAKLSSLVVCGDTGLGHLAVAQGRRVVMLMMHKNSGACVPFRHPDWALTPSHGLDITTISVAEAVTATELAFRESAL